MMNSNRRTFAKQILGLTAGAVLPTQSLMNIIEEEASKKMFFKISLAEWSLHKTLFAGKMTNLDFPIIAKRDFGIDIIEYVNQFFKDKAKDQTYLKDLLQRCKDNGVKNHLIMIDGEGPLAHLDKNEREKAIENHKKWVDAAKYLGCITIRVNLQGSGESGEVQKAGTEGLARLCEYAAKVDMNVVVENHGGYTSNGQWLAKAIADVKMKNCGILGDFGNFCIKRTKDGCDEAYDRYQGMTEFMPHMKAVSAKSYDFDEQGNCIETDYMRMMKIVKTAKFKGIVGIEYEGGKVSEEEGIRKTKALLEKVGKMI